MNTRRAPAGVAQPGLRARARRVAGRARRTSSSDTRWSVAGRESGRSRSDTATCSRGAEGEGVGTEILRRIEARARELGAGIDHQLRAWARAGGGAACERAAATGPRATTTAWHRPGCPSASTHALPAGTRRARRFEPGQDDRPLHEALTPRRSRRSPATSRSRSNAGASAALQDPGVDPELWLSQTTRRGRRLRPRSALERRQRMRGHARRTVRRWRRRGLGFALLHTHVRRRFYGRGARPGRAGVDGREPDRRDATLRARRHAVSLFRGRPLREDAR